LIHFISFSQSRWIRYQRTYHRAQIQAHQRHQLKLVLYSSKRSGGSYGSLSKSQVQPIYYITHKVESDDTFQRLALRYTINVRRFFFFVFLLLICFFLGIQGSRDQEN